MELETRNSRKVKELVSIPDVEKSPTREKTIMAPLEPGKSILKKIESHPDPEWVVDGVELTNIHKPVRPSPYSQCEIKEGPTKRYRPIRARSQNLVERNGQLKKDTQNDLLKIIRIRK